MTTHAAQAYLLDECNPPSLYVRIAGKKRRLFINRPENVIGIVDPGKQKAGRLFNEWDSIQAVYFPKNEKKKEEDRYRRLTGKYIRFARKATFTNDYIRKVLAADPDKSPYENRLTTGTSIDGQVISTEAVKKWCGEWMMERFRQAIRDKRNYHSGRFDFRGYDGSLWVETDGNGDVNAGFSKEFKDSAHGCYYLLINDDSFIGYDID